MQQPTRWMPRHWRRFWCLACKSMASCCPYRAEWDDFRHDTALACCFVTQPTDFGPYIYSPVMHLCNAVMGGSDGVLMTATHGVVYVWCMSAGLGTHHQRLHPPQVRPGKG
jgi:hypothetical protein